jgi:hypothetical protein
MVSFIIGGIILCKIINTDIVFYKSIFILIKIIPHDHYTIGGAA